LGLTYLVYPGAYHTRFHHAIGAMHLMDKAVRILRSKGHEITPEEENAVKIAILLHDIGHGPFSHALENSIVKNIHHETLSLEFMKVLNEEFEGKLSMAIQIFQNKYPKKFLHQLISSQLDMDRLDYLRRDSFYTGVTEGQVNTERLITMLNIKDDQIVVDQKGIYSVEKFIVSRRLMYWQVYLHKTVLSAEFLIIKILQRAREIYTENMAMPSVVRKFISGSVSNDYKKLLPEYAQLDDYDIISAIKEWQKHEDKVLSILCKNLLERKLLAVMVSNSPNNEEQIHQLKLKTQKQFGLNYDETEYFVFNQGLTNNAYDPKQDRINLLYKDGSTVDITVAADQLNISALAKPVTKNFLFFPKECRPLK
jgi:HD superfamily phosphohydrolase